MNLILCPPQMKGKEEWEKWKKLEKRTVNEVFWTKDESFEVNYPHLIFYPQNLSCPRPSKLMSFKKILLYVDSQYNRVIPYQRGVEEAKMEKERNRDDEDTQLEKK